jgi:hypothetical protein
MNAIENPDYIKNLRHSREGGNLVSFIKFPGHGNPKDDE